MNKMNRLLIPFIVLINVTLIRVCKAQNAENSVLWEISGDGLEKSSYLFGIINFLPKKDFSIPKKVKNVMDDCEVFATKALISRRNQKEFNQAARISNDGWINDYLTDDELNRLRLLMLRDLGVSENDYHFNYSRLQPIILVTATTILYLGQKNLFFVEQELRQIAQKSHLDLVGLGTIEEEIAAFDNFPIPDQVTALNYTIDNFDEHIKGYNNLVKNYVEDQDLAKIREEILKATNRSEVFQKVYYDDRQKVWTETIDTLVHQNPTFIAVGAAHLPGDQGLLQLLRQEGFTLNPIDAFE